MRTTKRETTAPPFIRGVPDYEIDERNMHITFGEWGVSMSLTDFERGMAKAARVIAEYRAKCAEIVPIRPKERGRGHAARS